MGTIGKELENKQYIHSIILRIYAKMQEFRKSNGKRPTVLVIGKEDCKVLSKLNLDWQLRNDNPVTIMGFKIEKVDGLDVNKIEVK